MHTLSVKELRKNLPLIRSELKKGEQFLIIYKSKPIAKLSPVENLSIFEESTDEEVETIAMADFNEENDFLTDEEKTYYLSLKKYN